MRANRIEWEREHSILLGNHTIISGHLVHKESASRFLSTILGTSFFSDCGTNCRRFIFDRIFCRSRIAVIIFHLNCSFFGTQFGSQFVYFIIFSGFFIYFLYRFNFSFSKFDTAFSWKQFVSYRFRFIFIFSINSESVAFKFAWNNYFVHHKCIVISVLLCWLIGSCFVKMDVDQNRRK